MSVKTQSTDTKQASDTNTIKDPDNWVSGADPMTGAQASYLETLSEQAHEPAPEEDLTKAEASKRIDELKHELQLDKAAPAKKGGR